MSVRFRALIVMRRILTTRATAVTGRQANSHHYNGQNGKKKLPQTPNSDRCHDVPSPESCLPVGVASA